MFGPKSNISETTVSIPDDEQFPKRWFQTQL